jgi:hypothetical protein
MSIEGNEKGFKLENTYTGKTIAAMIDFLKRKENKDKKVLFWNTFSSIDLNHYLDEIKFNWIDLPEIFHKFFNNKDLE